MHDLDRIESLLAAQPLDATLFERCAQDLLSEAYPDLIPIPGGTDWGRDADIRTGVAEERTGLLVTTSRTLDGIRKNMLGGIASLEKHNVPIRRIVLANPASLRQLDRERLLQSARKRGFELDAVFDRGYFASKRRDGYWRQKLLGLSSEPISLSRVPPELAESPWAHLPLVARQADLAALRDVTGDVIVSGPPGVGKSRLLQELPDVVFVDSNIAFDQICDDLRWLAPGVLVIDDAGQAEDLVRRLLAARRAEPDVFAFRVVAVCWTDEADLLRTWLRDADAHSVELLERAALDQLLVSMGITGELARAEILNQAEGRPGWAVALGDILLRVRDGASLLQGKALFGEVTRYLQRAGVSVETVDVLALVSALGGISEREVGEVAVELGLPRTSVGQMLTSAAHSGLIDVDSRYSLALKAEERHYQVRPPMLADVLVAERSFATDVPVVAIDSLLGRWPDRLAAITEAVIDAALLGAPRARSRAEALFSTVLAANGVSWPTTLQLAERYARIDRAAAEEVLSFLNTALSTVGADAAPWSIEPILRMAGLLARWYLFEDAVELLLDAAIGDTRAQHSHIGHPMRQLADIVHDFHPEVPPPDEQRSLVARVADRWIAHDPSDKRWRVYGETVQNILSLHLRSAHTAPGDHRTFQMIEAVVGPAEVERIYKQLWPPARQRLTSAPPVAIHGAIAGAEDWLRIGGGYDHPFGGSHPQATIGAAMRFGEQLLREAAELASVSPGLVVYARDVAERFGVSLQVELDDSVAVFFSDVDRREDWQGATDELHGAIAAAVAPWVAEGPASVFSRLRELRDQLELSSIKWPDRVAMACSAIAKGVEDPLAWIDAAAVEELLPEATAFLERIFEGGGTLGNERVNALLGLGHARWSIINAVLEAGSRPDQDQVINAIRADDYRLLRTLFLRGEVTDDLAHRLLAGAPANARGVVAAAMFAERRHDDGSWTPGALEADWLSAIERVEMNAIPGMSDYESGELTEFLAKVYGDTCVAIVERCLNERADQRRADGGLPHRAWGALHHLSRDQKDRLWSKFSAKPTAKWLLGRHLVGDDVDWLERALKSQLLTADDALESYTGFGPHPSIEELARLLVPLGVDPRRIASRAQAGSWIGDESEHYGVLAKRFEEMTDSDEQSLAAVGAAGVEMYHAAQVEAALKERTQRIRGVFDR